MQGEAYLEGVRTYWKHHKAFPPMAKLCDIMGRSSTTSVFARVIRTGEAGFQERTEGRIAKKKFFARQMLVPVSANRPQPMTKEELSLASVDDYLIDEPNRTYIHHVLGDVMKDLGFFDGDPLGVKQKTQTNLRNISGLHRQRAECQVFSAQMLPGGPRYRCRPDTAYSRQYGLAHEH